MMDPNNDGYNSGMIQIPNKWCLVFGIEQIWDSEAGILSSKFLDIPLHNFPYQEEEISQKPKKTRIHGAVHGDQE